MNHDSFIHRNILENMSSGVMTIGPEGDILTFNPSAGRILGLEVQLVLQQKFAPLFMTEEANDQFVQTVLDAVYQSNTVHNGTVPYLADNGSVRSLSVTTSFLQEAVEGVARKVGIIVVFDDVTEVEKLREAERSLTGDLKKALDEKEQLYGELQKYTRTLEQKVSAMEIEIDGNRRQREVQEITDSDYFKALEAKIEELRS